MWAVAEGRRLSAEGEGSKDSEEGRGLEDLTALDVVDLAGTIVEALREVEDFVDLGTDGEGDLVDFADLDEDGVEDLAAVGLE